MLLPEDLRAEIEQARRLGMLLYLHDRAAAIGSDIARANLRPADAQLVRGYLTFADPLEGRPTDACVVMFFTADDPPKIVCRVRVLVRAAGRPTFEALSPRAPASPEISQFMRARRTAIAALGAPIQPQNPVVLPGSVVGHDGVLVYLLAGSPHNNVAVFGKHHRALISPDGRSVMKLEPLSKTVIEISLEQGIPAGSTSAGLFITHLVTDYPLETHVFTSLLHRTPVFVGTARGVWRVDGDTISFPGKGPPG
jgi:hypothetical protein